MDLTPTRPTPRPPRRPRARGHDTAAPPARAWIRLSSGRRLDLADPGPLDFEDEDLAVGLSRTYRWGGHSRWPLPLSVAQHSLTVLALRRARATSTAAAATARPLTPGEELRELLHDADEALLGGFDCVAPLKAILGAPFAAVTARLQAAVALRYALPAWDDASWAEHKACDRTAAASEAVQVAGWTPREARELLGIRDAEPLAGDPTPAPVGEGDPAPEPWEPWPPRVAAAAFLAELRALAAAHRGTSRSIPRSPGTGGAAMPDPDHDGAAVRRFLDASTAHLSAEDRALLDACAGPGGGGEGDGAAVLCGAMPHGWFVHADEGEDRGPRLTPGLAALMDEARRHGCEYILLDADAPVLPGLAVHEDEPGDRP